MRILLFPCFFLLYSAPSMAQDFPLVLINGRVIVVKSVDLKDYTIAYRKMDGKKSPEDHWSWKSFFQFVTVMEAKKLFIMSDSMDTEDFKPEEMRMFILGEQDAHKFYRNNLNKGFGLAFWCRRKFTWFLWSCSSTFCMDQLSVLFLRIWKNKKFQIRTLILIRTIVKEGYERKARDRKIRNGVISGLIGFINPDRWFFNLIYWP